jgi:hypothetical protein
MGLDFGYEKERDDKGVEVDSSHVRQRAWSSLYLVIWWRSGGGLFTSFEFVAR